MRDHVHLQNRTALMDADELINHFGHMAQAEAATRADRSRALGNVVHFCHWRQIERAIDMLNDPEVTGTVH